MLCPSFKPVTSPLHGGDVDEHVLAAALGLDEAVSLLRIEFSTATSERGLHDWNASDDNTTPSWLLRAADAWVLWASEVAPQCVVNCESSHFTAQTPPGGQCYVGIAFSEAPMDAPKRVFGLIQLSDHWYWRLDIMRDDGLIGPFPSRDEAEKDARETLGIRDGDR
jgi:hypothetical protein